MDYERLWAPWRLEYVAGGKDGPPDAVRDVTEDSQQFLADADPECFLCRDVARYKDGPAADRANRVVHHSAHTVTVLNIYPYNNGHLLIAPRQHKSRLSELTDEQQLEIQQRIAVTTDLLERGMKADGFNIGLNLGRAAGAGLPGHLHWHVVPRWHGDSNFMTTLAGVRVIPQSLDALWEWLSEKLA